MAIAVAAIGVLRLNLAGTFVTNPRDEIVTNLRDEPSWERAWRTSVKNLREEPP
jgi:hypothetical protein